jgi:tRNA-uridine 2-sulfurtransferase
MTETRVAVALSGGVDSAMAAALLLEKGYAVSLVHLKLAALGPPREHLTALARCLGAPLIEIEVQEAFARQVVDYFVGEYRRGRTPNPCVRCNEAIKFGLLWTTLRSAGFVSLATGHYARLALTPQGEAGLWRGRDRRKDQSYFLSRLPRELLPNLIFPLGEMTKERVRARYRELGLPATDHGRESQELCFIPAGRYQEFLREHLGGLGSPGELVDTRGQVLGRHQGVAGYTVGQRRGLGVPSSEPYYVVEISPETNRVVVGRRADLLSAGLRASHVNWLMDPPEEPLEAQAVIRYRHPGVAAQITPINATAVQVIFATPQSAVAPGQAVAFYHEDRLLGGGWIEERIK